MRQALIMADVFMAFEVTFKRPSFWLPLAIPACLAYTMHSRKCWLERDRSDRFVLNLKASLSCRFGKLFHKLWEDLKKITNQAKVSHLHSQGIVSVRPPDTAFTMSDLQCHTWKMGASGSLLIATITLESFMPARCWIAPEMPMAMYSWGATTLPVCPTCMQIIAGLCDICVTHCCSGRVLSQQSREFSCWSLVTLGHCRC